MKNVYKLVAGFACTAVLLGLSAGAQAQGYPDVSWNINIGSGGPVYAPAPVYRHPPSVVVAPAAVYPAPVVVQSRPVVVAPAPVYYGAPGWRHGHGHGGRHFDRHGHGHGRGHGHRGHGGHGHGHGRH